MGKLALVVGFHNPLLLKSVGESDQTLGCKNEKVHKTERSSSLYMECVTICRNNEDQIGEEPEDSLAMEGVTIGRLRWISSPGPCVACAVWHSHMPCHHCCPHSHQHQNNHQVPIVMQGVLGLRGEEAVV